MSTQPGDGSTNKRTEERQNHPEQLPSHCHSAEGFFKDFFKDYCYYFRQIFCGFVNIVKPLHEFGEKETISVAGPV